MELDIDNALLGLFAMRCHLLRAGPRAEQIPEPDRAVVGPRHERESRRVDRQRRNAIEMSRHGMRALSFMRGQRVQTGDDKLHTCQYIEYADEFVFVGGDEERHRWVRDNAVHLSCRGAILMQIAISDRQVGQENR